MRRLKILIGVILSLYFQNIAMSQDLSTHQWKNRILLIITDAELNEDYINQLSLLRKEKEGLQDRKLKIYHIQPNQYKVGLDDKSWKTSNTLYQKYHKKNSFEVVLIGLDGYTKRHKSSILKTDELFAIIDAMPMRRAELRNKN